MNKQISRRNLIKLLGVSGVTLPLSGLAGSNPSISKSIKKDIIELGPYAHKGININCFSAIDLKIQLSQMCSEILCFPKIKLKISSLVILKQNKRC